MRQLMHSYQGQTPTPEIMDAVRRGDIVAICPFAYSNIESPAQLREMTDSLRRAAADGGHLQPIIGIDQEGGQLVAVTGGATELPGNMALGATRSPELARQAGQVLGRELLAMGVNMDFAPSVDVNINPNNPVVGIRSFGAEPALVADLGVALLQGLQAEGVIATVKHFPGHGDTAADSHFDVPVMPHSMARMDEVELMPFRKAIAAGVQAVMTAHIVVPLWDTERPATISPAILSGFLRHELGFNGLIITDAMDMYAIANRGGLEAVKGALLAGVDLVLLAHLPDQIAMIEQTRTLENADSVARIRAAQMRIPRELPSLDVVGSAEHQRIAQNIADHSITLVRDQHALPLRPAADDVIAVVTIVPADLTPADTSSRVKNRLAEAVQKRHRQVMALEIPYNASRNEIAGALQAVASANTVIIGTISADKDASQAELVRAIHGRGQKLIVVAMRTPYDLTAFPEIETYLCAYGIRAVTTEAVARVLFGEIPARGVLPCPIPGVITQPT